MEFQASTLTTRPPRPPLINNFFYRLSQNCGRKSKSGNETDVDRPDVDELEIFENKIESVTQNHRSLQDEQNLSTNFHRQPKMSTSNSILVAHNDVDVDVDIDEEDFFNPNRVSAKITVDVTVEFERENIYKTKIEEVPQANGL